MFIFGAHPLSFITRLVHVASMAFLLGGSLLLSGIVAPLKEKEASMLPVTRQYERFFWLAIGLILLTGIGNLGVYGAGLPARDTLWGVKLTLKLSIVLILLPLSLLRTLLVIRLGQNLNAPEPAVPRFLGLLYSATALILIVILLLAVSLAHG